MKIKGIQKTTVIDYPGRVACTLFLFGCNFRCGFCHNPELVIEEKGRDYSEEEVLDFLSKRKKHLDGVCFTGGEPLLSLEESFLVKIKEMGYDIKIDTNGSFPEKLRHFINKRLVDYVAMDIKASKERYNEIVNSDINLNNIEESIRIISNLENYEFRTTVIESIHSREEMKKIAIWLNKLSNRKPLNFSLQGFANSGKFIDASFKDKKDTSEDYLKVLKEDLLDYFENIEIKSG